MSNSPTHLRSSSSAFNFAAQPPDTQPQPRAPAQPVNVMVGLRPSMVSTPERALLPPAGGFQRRQSATPPEDHKPLPAAVLPSGAFTPLKPEQSVDGAVALVLDGAKVDIAAMRSGFAKLLSTRVAGGVDLDRAAVAMLQSVEARLAPVVKDGKHEAQPSAANPVLGAALQAMRSLPSANMVDLLNPLLAQTGQPDALIRAWFDAQTDDQGLIHGSYWTSALEALAAVASQANKSTDWVAQGLEAVVSALDERLAGAANAWTQVKSQDVVDDERSARLGIPTLTHRTSPALVAATARFADVYRSVDDLLGALGKNAKNFNAASLAAAVVRTGQVAAQHPVAADRPTRVQVMSRCLSSALVAGVGVEQVGRVAAGLRVARLALELQADAVMREVLAAIEAAVDTHLPAELTDAGAGARTAQNVDTQRAIKRQLLKASAQVAVPQTASPSSMQSSSTTTATSQSSSLG
ncbi:MAG: hypothetical protein V4609_18910 [Pseudomonadota bacterium]